VSIDVRELRADSCVDGSLISRCALVAALHDHTADDDDRHASSPVGVDGEAAELDTPLEFAGCPL
jgi:hypothetical protein